MSETDIEDGEADPPISTDYEKEGAGAAGRRIKYHGRSCSCFLPTAPEQNLCNLWKSVDLLGLRR